MAKEKNRELDNPLKKGNTRKATTREQADNADPDEPRVDTEDTVTGQGGATGDGGQAHSQHPSEHGGKKSGLDDDRDEARRQRRSA